MIATGQLQFKSNARAAEEFISLNGGLVGAYSHAESAGDFSLQKISYEEDCSYFKEALSLLGIILSIAEKPHVSTRREEVFAVHTSLLNLQIHITLSPDEFWVKA